MAEIDELKIVVSADVEQAIKAYEKLNKSLDGLRTNMSANAFALTKTASAINNFDGHTKRAAQGMTTLAKSTNLLKNALNSLRKNQVGNNEAFDNLTRRLNSFVNGTVSARTQIKELADSLKTIGFNKASSLDKATKQIEATASKIEETKAKLTGGEVNLNTDTTGLQEIGDNAEQATKSIDGTKDNVKKLKEELDGIKGGKNIGSVTKSIRETGKAAKRAGSDAKSGTKGLKKFVEQIKNIIKYRIVRRILTEIGTAMKEGLTNLYKYSDAMKSLDSNHTKKNLDALATTWLKVKNTLGVTLMSIINALMPAIQALAKQFIQLANVVNQFLAALAGESKYTKAIEYQTEAIKDETKANDKLKRSLLGFDEINALSDNSGGSGSSDDEDYSKMFKEEDIDENIKSFADKVRGFTEEIQKIWENLFKPLAFEIGDFFFKWTDLTPEDVAKKIIPALTGLCGGIIGWSFGGAIGGLVGTIAGVGLGCKLNELIFDNDGKLNDEEVTKLIVTAVGGLLGGATGAILCKKASGAAIGFTIGASLTAMLNSLLFNGDGKVSADEIGKLIANAVGGLILGIAGFKVAGAKGAVIGFTVGATLTAAIQSLMFDGDGEMSEEEVMKLVATALGGMIGAGIGIAVSPDKVKGATLGFTLGASVTALISSFLFDGDGSLDGGEIAKSIGLILVEAGVGVALSKIFKKLKKSTVDLSDAYSDKNKNLEKQTEDTLKETGAANGLKGVFEQLKIKTTDASGALGGLSGIIGALGLGLAAGELGMNEFNYKLDELNERLGYSKDGLNDAFGEGTLNQIETFASNSGNTIHEWSKNATDDINSVSSALGSLGVAGNISGNTNNSTNNKTNNSTNKTNNTSTITLPTLDFTTSTSNKTNSTSKTTNSTSKTTNKTSQVNPATLYQDKPSSSTKKETTTNKKNTTSVPKDNQGISGLQNLAQKKYDELNTKTVLQLGNALKNAGYQSDVTALSKEYKGDALKSALVNLAYSKFYTNLGVPALNLSGYGENVQKMLKQIGDNATSLPTDMSKWKWNDWLKVLKALLASGLAASSTSSGGGSNIIQFPTIKAAAVGGIFKQGDLILANEAGPELIGQMGNNTVVANNNQIIDGIKRGVFEAMASVMSQSRQTGTPIIENVFQVDSEVLYRATRKGEQKYNGRYTTAMVF